MIAAWRWWMAMPGFVVVALVLALVAANWVLGRRLRRLPGHLVYAGRLCIQGWPNRVCVGCTSACWQGVYVEDGSALWGSE